MSSHLEKIFEDDKLVGKIKKRLPHLFHQAELESSRAGRGRCQIKLGNVGVFCCIPLIWSILQA